MTRNAANPFRFDVEKATQAAGVLLREEPGRQMSYMKLLKLLYIAERESLRETGTMITGDQLVAMKNGPVLSGTLDLINGTCLGVGIWDEHIERERYHVSLRSHPGVGQLSRSEVAILQRVARQYRDTDVWEMVEITHEFPEWKNNESGTSSKPIPIREVLTAVDREQDADDILAEAAAQARMADMF